VTTRLRQPVADPELIGGRARVASYSNYAAAAEAVNYLAENKFPVERVSLVGRGVTLVEEVTGRAGYLDAALRGALAGGVTGALIGWLFGLWDWFNPVVASGWLVVDGFWFGALVGLLMGLLSRAVSAGSREFTSVDRLGAERYDLVVDEEVADEAKRLLERFQLPAVANGNEGGAST
jgi:hypothetical protein